jgi:hypothetical protein
LYAPTITLCQKAKVTNQKHGKLPAKQAKENPWDTLCVGLIGPCKIQRKGKKDLKPWCLTMIDPARTGWFEMEQIENKTAAKVLDICNATWFTKDIHSRNKLPSTEMVLNSWQNLNCGLKLKPVTTRNPEANAIVERLHQRIGNIIRNIQCPNNELGQSLDGQANTCNVRSSARHMSHCCMLQVWWMQSVFR